MQVYANKMGANGIQVAHCGSQATEPCFAMWCWFRDMTDVRVREVEILTSCFQGADKSGQHVTKEFLCEVP